MGGRWVTDWWISRNDGELCNREKCKGAATRARALRCPFAGYTQAVRAPGQSFAAGS